MDDLRRFVQHCLNKKCRCVPCFKDNLPGIDWGYGFLKRHKDIISKRHCQNITRKRAAVSDKTVEEYFERLQRTLDGPSTSGAQGHREVREARKVRKIVYEDSEEDESNDDQDINESEVMEIEEEGVSEVEKEIKPEIKEDGVSEVDKEIKPGSYCLVRFALKKSVVYYVGKTKGKLDDDVNDWETDSYRKCENDSNGAYEYMLPQTPDEGLARAGTIVLGWFTTLIPLPRSDADNYRLRATAHEMAWPHNAWLPRRYQNYGIPCCSEESDTQVKSCSGLFMSPESKQ
ncbi:hypothetical protein E2C01_007891 [Portunus trituberculatus]|uniref:Uncharacterized protein n=1 Tax=Portunus trituberculatus TaxID=210409 RepID=A0A5B7D0W0_PORTR|nr:hypothetical protein [Portunus trituberculatus]